MKKALKDEVDLNRLSEVADGDRGDMEDLARKYVQTVSAHLKTVAIAIAEKKWKDMERAAHAAVGTSSMVGMIGIVPSLRELQVLSEGDVDRAPALLKTAEKAFARIQKILIGQHLISGRSSAAK